MKLYNPMKIRGGGAINMTKMYNKNVHRFYTKLLNDSSNVESVVGPLIQLLAPGGLGLGSIARIAGNLICLLYTLPAKIR